MNPTRLDADADAYRTAERLLRHNRGELVLDGRIRPRWIDGGARFWYTSDAPDSPRFLLVDPVEGTREAAFDHARLATALATASGRDVDAGALPFAAFEPTDGAIEFDASKATPDEMLEAAIEAGADDVESSEEGLWVYCHPDELHQVAKVLEARFGEPRAAQITWRAKTDVPIDEETGQKLLRMIDALEESDDVQQVYANFEIADDVLERLSA